MQTFKVGDRVVSTWDWTKGLTGKVVSTSSKNCSMVLVEFSAADAKGRGHDGHVAYDKNDGVKTRWYFWPESLVSAAPVSKPTFADDLRLTPQAKRVLRHLKKYQSISPMEAMVVHSISRLASCIHEIRSRAGYSVTTEMRQDDHGHKYASYKLDKLATVH